MDIDKLLNFIEDKNIEINNDWYLHATPNDIKIIKKILIEGIKCAYLRSKKGNHFNGKYYVSLYKYNMEDSDLNTWLNEQSKIVISDINPLYADREKYLFRRMFINTRIPLRTSEWDGEYQQYLMVDNSKFVALGYNLSHILKNIDCSDDTIKKTLQKEKLQTLKDIILSMNDINTTLPIYDFSTKCEINKEKVISLNI